jgi:hypothetical protein
MRNDKTIITRMEKGGGEVKFRHISGEETCIKPKERRNRK